MIARAEEIISRLEGRILYEGIFACQSSTASPFAVSLSLSLRCGSRDYMNHPMSETVFCFVYIIPRSLHVLRAYDHVIVDFEQEVHVLHIE